MSGAIESMGAGARHAMAAGALLIAFALGACGSREGPSESYESAADDTALEHAGKHLQALYRCPMHPEITSDRPGSCPICGMNLVRVAPPGAGAGVDASGSATRGEPLFYRNPMDPSVTSPAPRKDEMGMDYVPVYADQLEGGVSISPAVLQNLGVRYAAATRSPLPAEVRGVGYVRYDERTIHEIRIRAEGWIEQLSVRASGDPVRRGERLFAVYSPQLATAEAELKQAIAFGDPALIAASERRLTALGVDRGTIAGLRRGGEPAARLAFHAPMSGIVDRLEVREGARVAPDAPAMRIVALDPIWVIVEVAESSLALVRTGAAVELAAVALPGRNFAGSVDYVYPELDPRTRTGRVRVVLANPDGLLLPDMYMTARISGPQGEPVVHVPLESVIRGGRSSRVIVALGGGHFEARDVLVGRESEERIEIIDGLAAGERVVASGVFLIDSEASLRSSLGRLGAAESSGASDDASNDRTEAADDGTGHAHHDPADAPMVDHSQH